MPKGKKLKRKMLKSTKVKNCCRSSPPSCYNRTTMNTLTQSSIFATSALVVNLTQFLQSKLIRVWLALTTISGPSNGIYPRSWQHGRFRTIVRLAVKLSQPPLITSNVHRSLNNNADADVNVTARSMCCLSKSTVWSGQFFSRHMSLI